MGVAERRSSLGCRIVALHGQVGGRQARLRRSQDLRHGDQGGEEVVRFAKPITASRLRALGDPSLTDCDDINPLIFNGAPELCDVFDYDCDGDGWKLGDRFIEYGR